jgi:aminopeptidase N
MHTKSSSHRKRISWIYVLFFLVLGMLACQASVPATSEAVVVESPTMLPTSTNPPTPIPPTDNPPAHHAAAPLPTKTPAPSVELDLDTAGDPYTPELGNSGYDVQRYTLALALNPENTALYKVKASTLIEGLATHPLDEIWLDFIGFEITELLLDGENVHYQRLGDKLVIVPSMPIQVGESFKLSVAYNGHPEIRQSPYVPYDDHLGFFYSGGENLYVLTEPDGARFWFPCNDHPIDKATFRFEITVPEGYTAVANGVLLEDDILEKGSERFVWEHNYPMATYLAMVAVGRYVRMDSVSPSGIPLRHYVFPNYHLNFDVQMAFVGEALDWMSDLFGPYPFEAFGFVSVASYGVSMETQTMVLLDTGMIDQETIVHEMTHMWFGDWVSLASWGEMWRNEGFATYFQWYYPYRDDPAGFERVMRLRTQDVLGQPNLESLGNLSPPNLFGYEAYNKGALAVHALRQEMGDEAFFSGLRRYFELYGGGVASDAEFKAVMETAAGISLDGFFAAWIGE